VRLSLSIDYDVADADPEVEAVLEEIVAEEARGFGETVRRRLAAEGVRDIEMTVTERPGP
jgi:hypothetical protein